MAVSAKILAGGMLIAVLGCDSPTRPSDPSGGVTVPVGQVQISSLTVKSGTDMVTISWSTNVPADTTVTLYRSVTDFTPWRTARQDSLTTAHSVEIAELQPGTTYFFTARSGTSTDSATTNLSPFITTIPDGPPEGQLTATTFSVIEASTDGRWYYAPLVTVRETTGAGAVTVTKMTFQIPGLGAAPPYSTSKCLMPSEERSLLNEIYGDFELTIDDATRRATSPTATGTLTYVDSKGRQGQLNLSGPIVAGTYPSTYSAKSPTWGCGSY